MTPLPSEPGKRDSVPREGESYLGKTGRKTRPDYKIDHDTGCWNWLKFKSARGYPGGHAHRVYWSLANGPIPEGFEVHHKCKNPSCVNPEHLEAIHPREHDYEHFLKERTGLTLDDVREIRRLGEDPNNTADPIAAQFGVSDFTIRAIWNGKRWAPELGAEGPVLPLTKVCAAPDCDEVFTGQTRKRRYCSKRCQHRHATQKRGGLPPEQKAKAAERQRRRRERQRAEQEAA